MLTNPASSIAPSVLYSSDCSSSMLGTNGVAAVVALVVEESMRRSVEAFGTSLLVDGRSDLEVRRVTASVQTL